MARSLQSGILTKLLGIGVLVPSTQGDLPPTQERDALSTLRAEYSAVQKVGGLPHRKMHLEATSEKKPKRRGT